MKKFMAVVMALCLSIFGGGCGGDSGNNGGGNNLDGITYETYGSYWMRQHNAEVMPVGAYNSLPYKASSYNYDYQGNESTYAAYKEAGVNVMMGLYESTNGAGTLQALDWCEDYGLSYLLPLGGADSFTNGTIPKSMLGRVRSHAAFGGIMQTDEPGRIMFEKIAKSAEFIEAELEDYADDALLHINLFPQLANQKQLYFRTYTSTDKLPEGGYDYERYVSDYLDICKPRVLSYDHYVIRGAAGNLSDGFFENMSYIRKRALEKNIPFWVFVQTCSFGGSTRLPNKAEVLWQVNASLSYGAKGIQYFTGVVAQDGGGETFDGAMFDKNGNKTDIYEYVKAAGLQIGAVDEVLMRSKSKGVIVTGPLPCTAVIPDEDKLSSYGSLVSIEAGHAFTGCFDFDGKNAFYVTNNSITEGDTVTLNFGGAVKGYSVINAAETAFSGQNKLTLTLAAGEGALVVLG